MSYVDQIAQAMRDVGNARARGVAANGQAWGGTVADMGALASHAYQQQQAQQIAQQEAEARAQQIAASKSQMQLAQNQDTREATAFQGQQAQQALATRDALHARTVQRLGAVRDKPELWNATRASILADGLAKPEDIPTAYPGKDAIDSEMRGLMSVKEQWDVTHPKLESVADGATLIDPSTREVVIQGTPKQPPSQEAVFSIPSLDGKSRLNVKGSFVPGINGQAGKYLYQGKDVSDAAGDKITERDPLTQELAQQRLADAKDKNKPLDISADIQTTRTGKRYVDLSLYSVGERDRARAAANASGAIPVSKEDSDSLREIDNARYNQADILAQISGKLPKDAAGRILGAPGRKLSTLFQADEERAAFGSWRTAAINSLRATAGSKGLRINQAEIAQAVENDIPTLNDTLATAQQKVKNINTLLDNAEKPITTRNRSGAAPAVQPPPQVPPPAGGRVNPFK